MRTETQILEKIDKIEKDIASIKTKMVDADSIMTEDDYKALLDYRKEKSAGEFVSHEKLRKELGL